MMWMISFTNISYICLIAYQEKYMGLKQINFQEISYGKYFQVNNNKLYSSNTL